MTDDERKTDEKIKNYLNKFSDINPANLAGGDRQETKDERQKTDDLSNLSNNSTFLHWYTIWRHIREITGKNVEKRALIELIIYFENQIDKVIHQSVKELYKLNELKKIQGLYPKKRIDKTCIWNAIKTLNSNEHSILSEKTGGTLEKKEKKSKKHLPKNDFLTEVT